MTDPELITQVKDVIFTDDTWIQGQRVFIPERSDNGLHGDPKDPRGEKWCVRGACDLIDPLYSEQMIFSDTYKILSYYFRQLGLEESLWCYNDSHSHSEIMNTLDSMILLAKEQEGTRPHIDIFTSMYEIESLARNRPN